MLPGFPEVPEYKKAVILLRLQYIRQKECQNDKKRPIIVIERFLN
jgi:hypothetical protein